MVIDLSEIKNTLPALINAVIALTCASLPSSAFCISSGAQAAPAAHP